MTRLSGKTAIITGGARGLGLAAARCMVEEGARVLVTDVDRDEGEAAARQLDGDQNRAAFFHQDVTDEAGWGAVFDEAERLWGGANVLVNNAGIAQISDIETMRYADWRRTLSINLDGVFLGTQQAIARCKTGGGSIVNIASIEGILGDPLIPAYNASKAGVRLLTRSAAIHCARSGYPVRINAVCPGFADTAMVSGALASLEEDQAQAFAERTLAHIPMGRFAEPDEIARAIVFLASDESSYMTGSDLVVDGGFTA